MVKSFFITIVALLFSTCLFGQETAKDAIKTDWPNTVSAFGDKAENEPSHYIFVIDISDKRFGEDIVKQIGIFAEALTKSDKISIIQLGPTHETKVIVSATDINDEILKEIKQKFQRLVSDGKFGTDGSDGKKMIELILKMLKAPGTANSIPFVFIFSDLEYYPYRNFPAKSEWLMLSNQFKQLKFQHPPYIKSFILDNPNKNPRGDYKDYLYEIFPKLEMGDVTGPQLLKAEFKLIQAEILRKKILNFVEINVNEQNANISLENKNGKIELKGSSLLVYHTLVLNEESEKKVAEILKSDLLYSFFPPTETEIEVSGTLVAEKYKNELPELKDVEIKNQKVTLMTADSLIPWWLTDIIIIVLLFSIFRLIWTIIPPAKLRGSMDFYTQGKSTIVIDCFGNNKKISNNEVSLLKNDFSLEIRATKKFFKGKCLLIYPLNGDLLLDSRKVKKTAPRGKKTIASTRSKWIVDGINITMPNVK
jgi:hypothetical protein